MTIVNTDTGEIIEPLTATELSALTHAEEKIKRGLHSFIEVGEALSRVRDERLYRAEFGTFEAYCRERWGITDRRARQMIDASEIVSSLPTGTMVPVSERQARALSGLTPEVAADVMHEANEATGGRVTASAIRQARTPKAPAVNGGGESVEAPARHPAPEPEPPTSVAEVDAFLRQSAGGYEQQIHRTRAEIYKRLQAVNELMQYEPQQVIDRADANLIDLITGTVVALTQWCDAIHETTGGLRVVNGGKS